MVLPVIAAAGARVAGTAVVRAGASTVARTGAQTAARGTSNVARKGIESGGRNIVRTRRNPGVSASGNGPASRPSSSNIVRTRNSARGQVTSLTQGNETSDDYEENYDNSSVPSSNESKKMRIGNFVALLLIMIAAFFDISELILDLAGTLLGGVGVVIGYLKDAVAFVFFPVVFWALGAPFWKGRKSKKKIIAMVSGFLISLVPWLGAFMPETLVSVAVTIFFTRAEDKGKDAEKSINTNVVRAKRIASRFGR
jgi:hypothetical protein